MNKEQCNNIYVYTQNIIDELYNDNAFTVIGLKLKDENNSNYSGQIELVNWINESSEIKFNDDGTLNVYIVRATTINKLYNLKQPYIFPDDLTIVCIKRESIADCNKLDNRKLEINAKWFKDFIDRLHTTNR